ncbi:MAG: hypothetical protein ACI8YQ_001795 [Polaribacter sp.]|jgi:hypothetical protein
MKSFLPILSLYNILLLSVLVSIFSCKNETKEIDNQIASGPLFEEVPQQQSGISFANNIIETQQSNHLMWSAIYNGAGVATGDINNDGLADIFFSGNLTNDALYLNKGNMQFTDITSLAGIRADGQWSTGVTFADVNQDGYLDIYVCRTGASLNSVDRKNLLYINNGDLTFTESAKKYGVADEGFSTQASFFDMDKDGDLDFFLTNQPPDSRLISRFKINMEENKAQWSDHLYLNTGKGKFEEIAEAAGVDGYGYGLNVVASDLNGDNLTDLYITNDYYEPDFMYINNGNNTFTNTINQSIKHISNFAMGSDVGDFNNDGLPDIGVVDMAAADHFRSKTNMSSMQPDLFWKLVNTGNHHQYMFNTLQLNNGNGSFSEIGLMAGMSKTDWSWSFLMCDFDNDGFKDISITNGIQRDIRNNDFQYNIKALNAKGQTQFMPLDVVNMIPSQPISNYVFKNNGASKNAEHSLHFSDATTDWGFYKPGFSSGMALADLDNDGDMDAVINNTSATASIYKNNTGNQNNYIRFKLKKGKDQIAGLNAKVTIHYKGQLQTVEITPTRGYLSASETVAHFGLGTVKKIDKVTIHWLDGKWSILNDLKINKTHTVDYSSATPTPPADKKSPVYLAEVTDKINFQHLHQENDFDDFEREILLPHKQSQHGPHISAGDVNGDGLEDFFVGGAAGFSGVLYIQNQTGFAKAKSQAWTKDKAQEDLGSLFFDADNDNDLDLYVVSGGSEFEAGDQLYQDRLYLNDGKGSFNKNSKALPNMRTSGEAVNTADFDQDGDLDLFVGGRIVPGKYPAPENSYLLQNNNGIFKDITNEAAPELKKLGMVTDALFSDYDGDGDQDLIVVGEWMKINIFQNDNNSFTNKSDALGLADSRAWWWSIVPADFDKDGDMDYLVGNLGKNTKFKASPEKPFMIYGNDFDQNGTNDVVLANYSGEEVVPLRGRECSSQQMPFIAEKFPTYEGFAKATLESIYSSEALNESVKYEITSFGSILLRNEGDHFEQVQLPAMAQIAPLRDFIVTDINKDGHMDAIGVGNMYPAEVETIRYDAGIGLCLLNDGTGGFQAMTSNKSGFFAPHDARSITVVKGTSDFILVGNNQEKVQVFKLVK